MSNPERYEKGTLFSSYSGGPYAYVEINRALPMDAFAPYALGYLEAATTLGDAAIRQPSDLAFYPLLHLFRHGVELSLKQLTFHAAKYSGEGPPSKLDHLIADLWRVLRPKLDAWIETRRDRGEPAPDSAEMDDIICDLVKVEPDGFSSRYPTTKAGADIHPKLSTVDFAKFVAAVRRSENILRTWMYQLEADASVMADYLEERHRTGRADRARSSVPDAALRLPEPRVGRKRSAEGREVTRDESCSRTTALSARGSVRRHDDENDDSGWRAPCLRVPVRCAKLALAPRRGSSYACVVWTWSGRPCSGWLLGAACHGKRTRRGS